MCADECGVVWPYLLESGESDAGKVVPDNIVEAVRAELLGVVAERRRCLQLQDMPEAKRRRLMHELQSSHD
jgi:hypothetical protein